MSDTGRNLRHALIEPRAVAVIGASDDATKTAGRPLSYLLRHGCTSVVYPINARRPTVLGQRSYGSVRDLPEPVDHAFITLPTEPAIEAAWECAEAGVPVITMLADGFAESGEDGRERQAQLDRITRETDVRILGPNSIGVVRTWNGLTLTANAAFAVDDPPKGRLTVLSQSGSLIGTLFSRGRARGIGFATLISVGNETDLSVGEIGEMLVDDPQTDAFLLFLETIRCPDRWSRFAAAARRKGKPILAYKIGRSSVGAELAVSHTGAIVGSDRAADSFLRGLGIVRVNLFETLIEAPPLFRHQTDLGRPRPVAVLTTTGGGGAMVADQLGVRGVEIRGASDEFRSRLNEAGVVVRPGHIIDLTLAGTRYDAMKAAVDALLDRDDLGAVVIAVGSSSEFFPELAVRPIIDAVREAAADSPPVAVFTVPQATAALRMLAEAGIAGFRTAEACADAVSSLMRFGPVSSPSPYVPKPEVSALLGSMTEPPNERWALQLFERAGISVPSSAVLDVASILGDGPVSLPFRFPVVAKLLSADLPHKTEAGAVTLDIGSDTELRDAVALMLESARAHSPDAVVEGVLVQEQCSGLVEALVGLRRDPAVGPVVTLGAGGILAEIYRDVAVRMAPLDRDAAFEMIEEVRAFQAIRGFRGRPVGDLPALADSVARLSALAAYERITEAEINPLLVRGVGQGVVAVDGLVMLADVAGAAR